MIDAFRRVFSGPAFILLLCASAGSAAAAPGTFIQTVPVVPSGLSSPLGVTHAGDGSGRLFVVERCGKIKIVNNGTVLSTPFLDVGALPSGTDVISCGGERGLLGLAFHPTYETNGLFYVYYTRKSDGAITIARYQVSTNPNVASTTGSVLLVIPHPGQSNHNGGWLEFGPDGYLYLATGDGGGGGDPSDNGQNLTSLLGKVLRIDVNGDDFTDPNRNYAIPPTNPFAGATTGADEIWAYGLRNPWRSGFDRLTGDLYIGDVGQGVWEEIDFQPASSPGGENYGWDVLEGRHCFEDVPTGSCNAYLNGGSVLPILEYNQTTDGHCAVTGGYVSRNLPSHVLYGDYLYGDFCSGFLWRAAPAGGGTWTNELISNTPFGISSFGEGETGRLYLTDLNSGALHWIAPYTFQDVLPTSTAWPSIEAIFEAGITQGCNTTPQFCPSGLVTRAEMAVFLVRAMHGPSFTPPAPTGVFADVPTTHWAAAYIEQLFNDGITSGCAASPARYCPGATVGRAEMAIFLLRAWHGSAFTPPPATGTVFSDVPASYWAAAWIEQAFTEEITSGCAVSPLRYCPTQIVVRDQMAVFLARTFELALP
jgi:glucose/arabinose dehydrogenase